MATSWSNTAKPSATSYTNVSVPALGAVQWQDNTDTWASATYTWASLAASWTNVTKP